MVSGRVKHRAVFTYDEMLKNAENNEKEAQEKQEQTMERKKKREEDKFANQTAKDARTAARIAKKAKKIAAEKYAVVRGAAEILFEKIRNLILQLTTLDYYVIRAIMASSEPNILMFSAFRTIKFTPFPAIFYQFLTSPQFPNFFHILTGLYKTSLRTFQHRAD